MNEINLAFLALEAHLEFFGKVFDRTGGMGGMRIAVSLLE